MKVTFDVPENLGLSELDARMLVGEKLYEDGICSTGTAASIVGMDRGDFIHAMGSYGKSIYDKTDKELKEDIEVARKFAY